MRLLRLLFYFCNTLHHLLKNHPAHGRFRRARNEATRHAEEPVGQAGDQLMATGAHRIHDASGQNLRRHAAFFFCIVRAIAAGVLGAGGLLPGVFQELAAIKEHLAHVNGTVATNVALTQKNAHRLDILPCADHTTDLALLKREQEGQGTNWNRVISIALAIPQAIILAVLLAGTK